MERPNGKDYGIGAGYKNDVEFNPVGYITALKEYIDYLEAQQQGQTLPLVDVSDMFTAEQMKDAYNEGLTTDPERDFGLDLDNYR